MIINTIINIIEISMIIKLIININMILKIMIEIKIKNIIHLGENMQMMRNLIMDTLIQKRENNK